MFELTDKDKKQLRERSIPESKFYEQLNLIKSGVPFINLLRPCTIGDGIRVLSKQEQKKYQNLYEDSLMSFNPVKFVPASGAASRMFGLLNKIMLNYEIFKKRLEENNTDEDDRQFLEFINRIGEIAFYDDLKKIIQENDRDIQELIKAGKFDVVIDFILTDKGLDYSNYPKGLIKFHKYEGHNRVAFEEHIVEALNYSTDSDSVTTLHFTILEEHEAKIREYMDCVINNYKKSGSEIDISYSFQSPKTDIVAVDFNDIPLRDENGQLVFRPGGHGALLRNLNGINHKISFIKNIDNVVPDRLKDVTYKYKKALAGLLIMIKSTCDNYLKMIEKSSISKQAIVQAMKFAEDNIDLEIPHVIRNSDLDIQKQFIFDSFNRPLRICGVVKNEGEPGGGPFWISDSNDMVSKQIVESAQVDIQNADQEKIWQSSTHFNPVDLVCSIYDYKGDKFDLEKFVDFNTVFITKKTKDGIDIKSMELPGLWNGSMAHWNTVFVEVPQITFNPVKTVMDLLKKEHLPEI